MASALSIFVTADPELPVPPRLYGGIERVIALLVDGLAARGHDVTLFAHPESHVDCRLIPYAGVNSASRVTSVRHAGLIFRETLRRRPDVIHSFGRLAYLAPVLPLSVRKVMSYQREVTPRTVSRAARLAHGTLSFVGCSRRLIEPVQGTGTWRVVYNGVAVDRYRFSAQAAADAPLVFLGRVEHIKGAHVAIDVAKRAGRRLIIAGNVPDEHRQYFETSIGPAIDGRQVTYLGPVDDAAKNELLGGAAALLMPVLWDEPFGIVMAEALACGTPVIGLDRGAVGEVIEDGMTGFVCTDANQMVDATTRLGTIDRAACRRASETRFSQAALADGYEAVYRAELGGREAGPAAGNPRARSSRRMAVVATGRGPEESPVSSSASLPGPRGRGV